MFVTMATIISVGLSCSCALGFIQTVGSQNCQPCTNDTVRNGYKFYTHHLHIVPVY